MKTAAAPLAHEIPPSALDDVVTQLNDVFIEKGTPMFMRTVLALFSGGFATFALLYCVQPMMPVLSHEYGINAAQSSLILSVATAMLAIGLLITGPISDAFGRKPVMVFALFSGPIGYLASFFMAWIINQLRFKRVFALAFYAPSITSSVAMSVVWLYIFSSDRYGFANNFLYNMGFINQPILWNQDASTIMPIIILISIWMSMGTGFLVFLAGLQNVSPDICEAGQIDGIRNRFQELIYITLPQMKPQLLFGAINAIAGAFGVFDIAVAFAGMPSPGYAAHTLVAHLYDYAFVRFEMGYASAVACVLFLLTFFFGRICMKIFASGDE